LLFKPDDLRSMSGTCTKGQTQEEQLECQCSYSNTGDGDRRIALKPMEQLSLKKQEETGLERWLRAIWLRALANLLETLGLMPSPHKTIILVPEDLTPSRSLHGYCTHMVHRGIHAGKPLSCKIRKYNLNWAWCHTPLIPALRKQRQADLCEFEVSLICKVEFNNIQGCFTEKPCLELHLKKKKKKKKKVRSKARTKSCSLTSIHTYGAAQVHMRLNVCVYTDT